MLIRIQLKRYFHTIRHLQFKQCLYRFYYYVYRPCLRKKPIYSLQHWYKRWESPLIFPACFSASNEFTFLNESGSLAEIGIWNSSQYSKLWLYNLHYFDALNTVDSPEQSVRLSTYIESWIAANPPLQRPGWEPYPLSLRIVNWIKWFARGNSPKPHWLVSLSLQAQALGKQLEYHILANHLWANAKALIFVGTYFSGREADAWLNKGLAILDCELKEQFLDDGGHFELSPMYHAQLLWDLCDLIHLANQSGSRLLLQRQLEWEEVLRRGLTWLSHMVHPDGEISFFNDAALGIAPTLADLMQYAEQLHIVQSIHKTAFALTVLPSSGYAIVDLPENGKAILDIAPIGPRYQPGHAHADTLSFELSLYGQRVLVNSGISQYGVGNLRQFQRGTKAHNTICLAGQNSSDVWAGFRVGRRAYPTDLFQSVDDKQIVVRGAHDGYRTLTKKHIHTREWCFSKDGLTIQDRISHGDIEAVAHFYFHPDVHVVQEAQHVFRCYLANQQTVKIIFDNAADSSLETSYWYPRFGVSIPNLCLVVVLKYDVLNTHIAGD